jgi:hypothetical protein
MVSIEQGSVVFAYLIPPWQLPLISDPPASSKGDSPTKVPVSLPTTSLALPSLGHQLTMLGSGSIGASPVTALLQLKKSEIYRNLRASQIENGSF